MHMVIGVSQEDRYLKSAACMHVTRTFAFI